MNGASAASPAGGTAESRSGSIAAIRNDRETGAREPDFSRTDNANRASSAAAACSQARIQSGLSAASTRSADQGQDEVGAIRSRALTIALGKEIAVSVGGRRRVTGGTSIPVSRRLGASAPRSGSPFGSRTLALP